MNKYKLEDFLKDVLAKHQSTFKVTSYDIKNNHYLCSDTVTNPVFDFDSYVEANFEHRKLPASPDAIYIGDKKLYFVEFKNQKAKDIDPIQMKSKFTSGTTILQDLLKDFTARDNQYYFCVVHKDNETNNWYKNVEVNVPKFDLAELNDELGGFYDKIFTRELQFYKDNFPHLRC
ncbi:hypothetical protein OURE66S_00490 [Oligella ureolytica]|nr:hypothetical protein [Alcaligenaceae bacterium]